MIIAGEQTYTVFKDTRELAKQTAAMVDAALKGEEVPVNDTTTYDNGVKIVPSYLLIPHSVDINNYKELLVDSGTSRRSTEVIVISVKLVCDLFAHQLLFF